jgi:hypothetical protein
MFNDGHVKTIYDLEMKIPGHCSIDFKVPRGFVELYLMHP